MGNRERIVEIILVQSTDTKRDFLLKVLIPSILGIVFLWYILTTFEWKEIWKLLQSADIVTFSLTAVVTTLIFWLLRTLRWSILLKTENTNIALGRLYLYTAVTVGFANFTPFQAGEALKVEFARKDGGPRISGYKFFFFEKLFDLIVIGFLAVLGVFVMLERFVNSNLPIAILVLTVVSILTLIAVFWFFWKRPTGSDFVPGWRVVMQSLLLTLASWAAMILGWKLMFGSILINLSLLQTSAVIALTTVAGILSFVPGAIGVTEVTVAVLLAQLGFEQSLAQAGAVLIGLYSFVVLLLAIFHLCLLKISRSWR